MEFNIPKRNYVSDASKVVAIKMPVQMKKALEGRSQALGWTFGGLIDLILDQFFSAISGRAKLPETPPNPKYMEGDRIAMSLRLDQAVCDEMEKWSQKAAIQPKTSQLIFLALNTYLTKTRISK